MKRAQRRDVQAAIVAKDAQAEAAVRADAAMAAQAAAPKSNPKATKCPELRGNISFVEGVKKVWCLKCKKYENYTGWPNHCADKHPVDGPAIEKDEGADRPGLRAAGAGGAVSRKEAKRAAPGRRQKAPSDDQGTQKTKKASVAPKER